jgi:hypothetical protein
MGVRPVRVEVLELPFPPHPPRPSRCDRNPLGTFDGCPICGGAMAPEHAHFRCAACGWRDSCCD